MGKSGNIAYIIELNGTGYVQHIPCPFVIVQPIELRQLVREAAETIIGMVRNTN